MKELKRVSNHWLKERGRDYAAFEWQGGYYTLPEPYPVFHVTAITRRCGDFAGLLRVAPWSILPP